MISPLQLQKKPIYSQKNASEVLEAFLQKHTRGTMIFAKKNRIPQNKCWNMMLKYYMYNQRRWFAVKKTIKTIEKMETMDISEEIIKNYLTFYKENYLFLEKKIDKSSEFGQFLSLLDKYLELDYIT